MSSLVSMQGREFLEYQIALLCLLLVYSFSYIPYYSRLLFGVTRPLPCLLRRTLYPHRPSRGRHHWRRCVKTRIVNSLFEHTSDHNINTPQRKRILYLSPKAKGQKRNRCSTTRRLFRHVLRNIILTMFGKGKSILSVIGLLEEG